MTASTPSTWTSFGLAIRELGDGKKCVMLVGHNPEFTDLAHLLLREIGYLPTRAVAEFAFDAGSWTKALRERPARALLHTPAQI